MNIRQALPIIQHEYNRQRLTNQRTREEATTKPTVEGLMTGPVGDLWTREEAEQYVAEWDELEELRDWQRGRDKMSALRLAAMAIEAIIMVEDMRPQPEGQTRFPEFTFMPEADSEPAEVIGDLLRSLKLVRGE